MWKPFAKKRKAPKHPTVTVTLEWVDGRRAEQTHTFGDQQTANECFEMLTGISPAKYFTEGAKSFSASVNDKEQCFFDGREVQKDFDVVAATQGLGKQNHA